MTKTDWTAAEVRAEFTRMRTGEPTLYTADMLAAFANRIEADESAVPVAWMRRTIRHKRIGGREEGERVMSASKVYPDDEPLFTHPPAQPAQEQPGWKVPEGEVRLWDTQWMDIVNHDNCYRDWDKTDAINHAVKMTEQAIARNVADGKLPPAHKSASPTPPKEK